MNTPTTWQNESMQPAEEVFQQRFTRLVQWLRSRALKEKNIDAALNTALAYGEFRAYNNDGVYSDDSLEEALEIKVIESAHFDLEKIKAQRGDKVLVLATELYNHGGHTKVLMTWLDLARTLRTHRLVVTRSLTAECKKQIHDLSVELQEISSFGIKSIGDILSAANGCNIVVLHTHPQDIYAAIAVRLLAKSGLKVIFYNHSDHLFSFGIGAAHRVGEVSSYGMQINQLHQRTHCPSIWMGIPIKTLDIKRREPNSSDKQGASRIVLSAGSVNKYRPDEEFIFAEFVTGLIDTHPEVTMILVGPTGKENWWGNYPTRWGGRVKFLGFLPGTEYMQLLAKADVFVDSYPITGGTAFPEALLRGKLCAGLATPVQGYSCADVLKVATSEQLVQRVGELLVGSPDAVAAIQNVKGQVLEMHSTDAFLKKIALLYNDESDVSLLTDSPWQQISQPDCLWIERRWHHQQSIAFPRIDSLLALKISLVIGLLFRAIFNFKYCARSSFRRVVLVFIATMLPQKIRPIFMGSLNRFR